MTSREQVTSDLNAYGVALEPSDWNKSSERKEGEFGIFAIIIRVIAGLFILGMMIISIGGLVAILGFDGEWYVVTTIIGLIATIAAAIKFRNAYSSLERQYSFMGLLWLSFLLVGKACLLASLYGWFEVSWWRGESAWVVALTFAAITIASCIYYKMYLEAFLAIVTSIFLLDTSVAMELARLIAGNQELSAGGAANSGDVSEVFQIANQVAFLTMIPLIAGAAALLRVQQKRYLSSVYLYAVLLFIGYKLLPTDELFRSRFIASSEELRVPANWWLNALAFVSATALFAFIQGGLRHLAKRENLIVVAVIALLAAVSMHGVLLALCLLALGHVRHDRVLWAIGLIYLPVFLFSYYYTLNLDLLTKSYILVASGLAILGARYVLGRFFIATKKEQANA